jgi:tRNA-specific 2-thiouridylase
MKRVIIGLSGGVDSSVAAYLLKQQGFEVIALFMINWKDSSVTLAGDCAWEEDIIVAKLVAQKIGIPLEVVDSSEKYKQAVVDYMFLEYEKGRTPNPDVLCNREIKFDIFQTYADKFNADFIATGHYAKTEKIITEKGEFVRLLAGDDKNKDQSYFLCQLSQKQLKNVLFPIGNIEKTEVRRIAAELDLASATKKDSQGICFVGKVDLPTFLQQKLAPQKGKIIEIEQNDELLSEMSKYPEINFENLCEIAKPHDFSKIKGKIVGEHNGAHYYTIGQRKGLNVGGKAEPLFVLATNIEKNIIYVGQGHSHFGLNRSALFIQKSEIHWIRPDLEMGINEKSNFLVRIRYRQELQKAQLIMQSEGLYIIFEDLQRGITAGQFAAWYNENELIGSGVIFE